MYKAVVLTEKNSIGAQYKRSFETKILDRTPENKMSKRERIKNAYTYTHTNTKCHSMLQVLRVSHADFYAQFKHIAKESQRYRQAASSYNIYLYRHFPKLIPTKETHNTKQNNFGMQAREREQHSPNRTTATTTNEHAAGYSCKNKNGYGAREPSHRGKKIPVIFIVTVFNAK